MSGAHFSSDKADIWHLFVVYAYFSYKKVSIKKYYILGILRSKLRYMPIYGHMYIAHSSVIFGPITNIFILGRSRDDYLPERLFFGWVGGLHNQIKLQAERERCRDSGAFW